MSKVCETCNKPLTYQKRFCSRACKAEFQKGKKFSEETKSKMRDSRLKYFEDHPEAKDIISDSLVGNTRALGKTWTLSEETKQSQSKARSKYLEDHPGSMSGEDNPFYGHTHSDETKSKISESLKSTWDSYEYDSSRPMPEYRRLAIDTYEYKCVLCRTTEGVLHVHHIDGDHYNDDISNLCILCSSCHRKIHTHKDDKGHFMSDNTPDRVLTQLILEQRKLK